MVTRYLMVEGAGQDVSEYLFEIDATSVDYGDASDPPGSASPVDEIHEVDGLFYVHGFCSPGGQDNFIVEDGEILRYSDLTYTNHVWYGESVPWYPDDRSTDDANYVFEPDTPSISEIPSGNGGGGDDPPTGMNQLYVEAASSSASFRVEVDGSVEPEPGTPADEFGVPGTTHGDDWIEFSGLSQATYTWNLEGAITRFDVTSGSVYVEVNDEPVTPGELVAHYDHSDMNRAWFNTGEGETFSYDIEVSGDIVGGSGFDGSTSGSTASDEVSEGGWSDVYYTGSVVGFDYNGSAEVVKAVGSGCESVGPDGLLDAEPADPVFEHHTVNKFVHHDGAGEHRVRVSNQGDETAEVLVELEVGSLQFDQQLTIPGGQEETTDTITYAPSDLGPGEHDYTVYLDGESVETGVVQVEAEPADVVLDNHTFDPVVPYDGSGEHVVNLRNDGGQSATVAVELDVGSLTFDRDVTVAGGDTADTSPMTYTADDLGPGDHSFTLYLDGSAVDSGSVEVQASPASVYLADHSFDSSLAFTDTNEHDVTVGNDGGQASNVGVSLTVGSFSDSKTIEVPAGSTRSIPSPFSYNADELGPGTHDYELSLNSEVYDDGTVDVADPNPPVATFDATTDVSNLEIDTDARDSAFPLGQSEYEVDWYVNGGHELSGSLRATFEVTDHGEYTIELEITGPYGQTDSSTSTVVLDQPTPNPPSARFSFSVNADERTVTVDADTGTYPAELARVEWFVDGGLVASDDMALTVDVDEPGTYLIELEVEDVHGQSDDHSASVTVPDDSVFDGDMAPIVILGGGAVLLGALASQKDDEK